MICQYGRRFLLCLVLSLLLLSPTLSAEVCLTDDEFQELQTLFAKWETVSTEQETRITTLESQLVIASELQQTSATEITRLRALPDELKKYYEMQMHEQRRKALTAGLIATLISLLAGFIAGRLL